MSNIEGTVKRDARKTILDQMRNYNLSGGGMIKIRQLGDISVRLRNNDLSYVVRLWADSINDYILEFFVIKGTGEVKISRWGGSDIDNKQHGLNTYEFHTKLIIYNDWCEIRKMEGEMFPRGGASIEERKRCK